MFFCAIGTGSIEGKNGNRSNRRAGLHRRTSQGEEGDNSHTSNQRQSRHVAPSHLPGPIRGCFGSGRGERVAETVKRTNEARLFCIIAKRLPELGDKTGKISLSD